MKDTSSLWRGLYRPEFAAGRKIRIPDRIYDVVSCTESKSMCTDSVAKAVGMARFTPLLKRLLNSDPRFRVQKELINRHWQTIIYAQ